MNTARLNHPQQIEFVPNLRYAPFNPIVNDAVHAVVTVHSPLLRDLDQIDEIQIVTFRALVPVPTLTT